MKITSTTTEIECTAEELRQSASLSEGFMNMFRNLFNGAIKDDEKVDCTEGCENCVNKGACDYEERHDDGEMASL